jgi:dTMP kinase
LESEPDSFQERTRAGFLARAAAEPQRFRVVDASQSIDDVWNAIRADIDMVLS